MMPRIPDLLFGFLLIAAPAMPPASHFLVNSASAQQQTMRFQDLPKEVRNHVDEIRQSCKELDPEFKPYDAMQGINVIDLNGDGSRDLMVDNEEVCNSHMAGANCSNRGCDLIIWKQAGGAWKTVFKEHLHRKFISLASDTGRFQLMAASIYAGDPKCKPDPRKEYTSGKSCDLLITYRNGQWVWQPIR